jgi:hypothetical protein
MLASVPATLVEALGRQAGLRVQTSISSGLSPGRPWEFVKQSRNFTAKEGAQAAKIDWNTRSWEPNNRGRTPEEQAQAH